MMNMENQIGSGDEGGAEGIGRGEFVAQGTEGQRRAMPPLDEMIAQMVGVSEGVSDLLFVVGSNERNFD